MTYRNKFIGVLRILLGVILVVFGLNGLIGFLPMPEAPAAATEFMKALSQAGYFIPLLYGLEVLIGLFLLLNIFTPLMVLGFVPIALNILLYHLFLDPAGGAVGYFTVIIEIALLWAYSAHYTPLFRSR